MRLETERLVLRDLKEGDEKYFVKYCNDLDVSQYLLLVPYPYTENDGSDFVKYCISESKKEPRINYELGITLKESNELIGVIAVSSIDYKKNSATIGYWIGKPLWRKGYVSEALEKIIDFSFNELNLKELKAGVFEENIPSAKLLEKMGFENKGPGEYVTTKSTGKKHREIIYILSKSQ